MSKIIIIITPVEGHFNPLVPIMTKLIERKHEILCITASVFKRKVEKTGAVFMPIPAKWDFTDKDTYDIFPELKQKKGLSQLKFYLKHVMLDSVPDAISTLKNALDSFQADIVLSDSFMIAGSWITQLGGPPNVLISPLPLYLPGKSIAPFGLGLMPGKSFFTKLRNVFLKFIFEKILFNDIQTYCNRIRIKLDLEPYKKSFLTKGIDQANLYLQLSAPSFEYNVDRYPSNLKFIGPTLLSPQEDYITPAWWQKIINNQPVILVNQGTVAKNLKDLILPTIEALKHEEMIILAVPVKEGEIKNLPKNVIAESYIPFGNILPHVDLMITNGGYGGTQNALSHGIPVIIAGATEDKMEVAARVEYSGAGINLGKKPSPSNIKKTVMKIISDPSYKKRAIELQSEFSKYDAPNLAVEYIEDLIEKQRSKTLHNIVE